MARLRHEKARLVRMSDTPTIRAFLLTCQTCLKATPQGLEPYF